ncbi:hypothetical protein HDU79_012068, partial [Rhizoclosmatium sp. JEL0117]
MKVLWVVFKTLNVEVPSLKSVLAFRKKFGGIQPQCRQIRPGVAIYVRPIPELVKVVFRNAKLAAAIQRSPKPSSNPKEMFESQAYSKLAPRLSAVWSGSRFYRGDTLLLQTHQVIVHSFSPDLLTMYVLAGNSLHPIAMAGPPPICLERGKLSKRDETSGNKTKRYNPFESGLAIWAALPKEYHSSAYINFVATTHEGDWRDLAEAALSDLAEGSDLACGLKVWDAHTKSY